jgi:TolA-binding protein
VASRKRLTKKEIKHDPIIERTLQAWGYLVRNRNRAITAGMAVVAVAALAWGVSAYQASHRAESDTDLGRAMLHMQTGERDKAVELLTDLTTQKRGSEAGKRASYYLAYVKFEGGDYAASRDLYEQFRRRGVSDPFLKASAAKGVADCDVELGKYAEAGREYLAVADEYRDVPLAPECLYLAGLALSKAGDAAQATDALQRLIDGYPEFGRLGDARVLLGELQAQQRLLGQSLEKP